LIKIVLLAALLIPAPALAVRPLDLAVYASSEFDAATTYRAVRSCGAACIEANPILRPIAGNPAIFFALGGTAWLANREARYLREHGHGRWARAVQVLTVGMHVFAGASNIMVAK